LTSLLVHCLAAPFAAACEWLWLGTRLTLREMLCGVVVLAGVALALAPNEHLHLERKVFWPGVFFGILAALGQGLGAVLSRHAFGVAQAAGENIDGLTAAFQRIIGGVVLAGLFLLLVKRVHFGAAANGTASLGVVERWRGKCSVWGWIVLNALTGPTLGVGCFQWALKTIPSGIVLPIVATVPVVIIPFSVCIEGERITARSVVGGVLAVLGAVMLALLRNAA
jgi:drug/metabolite transporter (DMT)-like permease